MVQDPPNDFSNISRRHRECHFNKISYSKKKTRVQREECPDFEPLVFEACIILILNSESFERVAMNPFAHAFWKTIG